MRGAMDFLQAKRTTQFPDADERKACATWAKRSAKMH